MSGCRKDEKVNAGKCLPMQEVPLLETKSDMSLKREWCDD
jgi:hypothetical protein